MKVHAKEATPQLGVSSQHCHWESPNKPSQAEAGLNHALIAPWSDNALGDRAGLGPPLWGSGASARDPAGQAPPSTLPGCPDVISAISFILSIRAGLGEQQQCRCPRAGAAPLASHWGIVGPAAFSLHPHSLQLTPSPPPLRSFPPAPSNVGLKAEGRWERAGRGWRWGGTARGHSLGCRLRWRSATPAPLPPAAAHLAGCSCPR